MELPNYFLADLPDASTITPRLLTEACETLKQNREKFLLTRGTDSIIAVLATIAKDWLDPEYPFRKLALEHGPAHTGFSRETLEAGLTEFFAGITHENLEALIVQDLGSMRRLDELVSDEIEVKQDRASLARGTELLVQITGGVLPNPVLTAMMLALLARSAQFIKCASGTSWLPRMFAHSIYAVQPKLASCIEIAEWKGGCEPLEEALFAEATCVSVTGSDDTLGAVRRRLPSRTRFLGYGHRISVAYVARESLAKIGLNKTVAAAAADIAAWDQLGCLSPQLVYVETGGAVAPLAFAEALAKELERLERERPRGELAAPDASAIATRRMFYSVRAANHESTRIWASDNSTAWTVVFEDDPQFQSSPLHRFIYVKPVADPAQVLESVAPVQKHLSTVGLAAPIHRAQEIAADLARRGVPRICPAGRMQNPPLTWRHDGRPGLGDLVAWTDFEFA